MMYCPRTVRSKCELRNELSLLAWRHIRAKLVPRMRPRSGACLAIVEQTRLFDYRVEYGMVLVEAIPMTPRFGQL
jgi:hypothetical protein